MKTEKDMYIVLSKTTTKTAIIRNQTELADYLNVCIRKLRKSLSKVERLEIGDFIVIKPDYVQIKSNSGGRREKKYFDV